MRQVAVLLAPALLLLASGCASGDADASGAVTRDSAGVAIVEYPATAWADASEWQLSSEPLAVMGGDLDDAELDLSNSFLGLLLPDNRVVAASIAAPPQVFLFAADGSSRTPIGGAGEGPGEYMFVTGLTRLGSDTIAVYDLNGRKALLFTSDGEERGRLQVPFSGDVTQPPQLIGRASDGTWVFRPFDQLNLPGDDAPEQYRKEATLAKWQEGGERLDSMMTVQGPLSIRSALEMGGQSIPFGRPLAHGPNSSQAVSGDLLWSTPGDVFVLRAHDMTGKLVREVRVPMEARPVTEAEREAFRARQREGLERARSFGAPPQIIESELAKVEAMPFADTHAAIGQLTTDNVGRLWATTGLPVVDSVLAYGVFSSGGSCLGTITLPGGFVLGANEDRVVIRREDPETGLVRLEVWGLVPPADDAP